MPGTVTSYQWPHEGCAFARVGIRIEQLAMRRQAFVEYWAYPELGGARGFAFRAASGRIFMLEQLDAGVDSDAVHGPKVYADLGDVCTLGVPSLVEEVIAELTLTPEEIVAIGEDALEKVAAELLAHDAKTKQQS